MGEDPDRTSGFTIKKKVDESWKDTVAKEKDAPSSAKPEKPQQASAPDADFSLFLSTIGMQALLALGEIPHPTTGEKKTDLAQSSYLINVIQMLQDKTKGNISEDEAAMVKDLLYELRVKFVQKTEKK